MVHPDGLVSRSPLEASLELEDLALAQVDLEQVRRQLSCGLPAVVQVAMAKQFELPEPFCFRESALPVLMLRLVILV